MRGEPSLAVAKAMLKHNVKADSTYVKRTHSNKRPHSNVEA